MARSITFKFGADTSSLTRSLKGIRKSIGGMMGGISLGGILGAGIAGFGLQQAIGAAMNEAEEKAIRGFAEALYHVQPQLLELANTIPELIAAIIKAIGNLSMTYRDVQRGTTSAAGYFTESAMGIGSRLGTASSWGELFGPSLKQAYAGYLSLPGAGLRVPQEAIDLIGENARRDAGRSIGGLGGQARTQSDPARSADPRP